MARTPAELSASPMAPRTTLAARLAAVRARTLAIVEPLDDAIVGTQHAPYLSPIAWDLGHVAAFEEAWIARRLGGRAALRAGREGLYDPFEKPRTVRGGLPLLT